MNVIGKKKQKKGETAWFFPEDDVKNDFILVTEENRSKAVVLGRIMYVLERGIGRNHKKMMVKCFFEIRPRLYTSKIGIENHPYLPDHEIRITQEESKEDYARSFKQVIDDGIQKKNLYINLKDPLVNFVKL